MSTTDTSATVPSWDVLAGTVSARSDMAALLPGPEPRSGSTAQEPLKPLPTWDGSPIMLSAFIIELEKLISANAALWSFLLDGYYQSAHKTIMFNTAQAQHPAQGTYPHGTWERFVNVDTLLPPFDVSLPLHSLFTSQEIAGTHGALDSRPRRAHGLTPHAL